MNLVREGVKTLFSLIKYALAHYYTNHSLHSKANILQTDINNKIMTLTKPMNSKTLHSGYIFLQKLYQNCRHC